MNLRDQALQTLTPTVMVPKFEPFEPLETIGHRFLVAADGLWLEIRRAWLYARLPVAQQGMVAMPYGTVTPCLELVFRKVPQALLTEFTELAKAGLPNEVAAAVIWHEGTGYMRLQQLHAVSASPGHITYQTAVLGDGEHAIVDLHSHGHSPAYFSATDNVDDYGTTKVSGVVGNLDKPEQTYAFRLCAQGLFVPL